VADRAERNTLFAKRLGEITVVCNDQYTTPKIFEGLDEGSKRFPIEIVCENGLRNARSRPNRFETH